MLRHSSTADVILNTPLRLSYGTRDATAEYLPDEALDKSTACETPEGAGGDGLPWQELEEENGWEKDLPKQSELPQQSDSSPGFELRGADRGKYVEPQPSSYGGGDCYGCGGGGDGDGGDLMKEKEEPGVWGPDGLLAIPNVKMVLFLACA
ncbi:unnamed protein product, partial [Laminaria digitata]